MTDKQLVPEGQPIMLRGSDEPENVLWETGLCHGPDCAKWTHIGPTQQVIVRRFSETNPIAVFCPSCCDRMNGPAGKTFQASQVI